VKTREIGCVVVAGGEDVVEWWLRNFIHVVMAWNEGTIEGKERLVAKLR